MVTYVRILAVTNVETAATIKAQQAEERENHMVRKNVSAAVSIIILMLAVSSSAYNSGRPVDVFNIGQCYGDLKVKVTPHGDIGTYSLMGCKQTDEIWYCPCSSNTTIKFVTTVGITNVYDFMLQYFSDALEGDGNFSKKVLSEADKRDMGKRQIVYHQNVTFSPEDENNAAVNLTGKEEVDMLNIIYLAVGISLFCLFVAWGVWRIFNNKVEQEEEKRRQERKLKARPPITQTDEELIAEARKIYDAVHK